MTSSPVSLLGIGIYTRAEAARFLGLSPARIGSWLRGYRYSWGPRNQRRHGSQPPVLKTDIPRFEGSLAISFLELMERSEEHTSELQSQSNLVCRLLLEKKKKI